MKELRDHDRVTTRILNETDSAELREHAFTNSVEEAVAALRGAHSFLIVTVHPTAGATSSAAFTNLSHVDPLKREAAFCLGRLEENLKKMLGAQS